MKTTKLFGVPMTKGAKFGIVTGFIMAVIFLMLYLVLGFVRVPKKETAIIYPENGLTQSIFDSQNMEYTKVEGYPERNLFVNVPYSIDMPSGKIAKVGFANICYTEPYYFYYSEIKKGGDVEKALKSELTGVLLMDAYADNTTVEVLEQKSGYINGFEANYFLINILAQNGTSSVSADMVLYELSFNESIYESEYSLLVGCMTNSQRSTESLSVIQTLAVSGITTVREVRK